MDGFDPVDAGDLPLGKTIGLTLPGDPISSEEYTSADFMQREMDRVWARVWNVGGLASEILEPGRKTGCSSSTKCCTIICVPCQHL